MGIIFCRLLKRLIYTVTRCLFNINVRRAIRMEHEPMGHPWLSRRGSQGARQDLCLLWRPNGRAHASVWPPEGCGDVGTHHQRRKYRHAWKYCPVLRLLQLKQRDKDPESGKPALYIGEAEKIKGNWKHITTCLHQMSWWDVELSTYRCFQRPYRNQFEKYK